MKKFCILLLLLSSVISSSYAQQLDRDSLARKVGRHVDSIGAMLEMPLKTTVTKLYRNDFNQVDMTYAIYTWVAKNVAFDPWAYNHKRTANYTASSALNTREATSHGIADLVKSMCDLARIECVVIEGQAKAHPSSITRNKKLLKHYWNAVKIKNTWYYLDATFGAGYTDKTQKVFTKEFTDVWCFANRELFTMSHFPFDKKWQFIDEPITQSMFQQAPIVGPIAMKSGIYWGDKVKGRIRAKVDDCKRLAFDLPANAGAMNVALLVNDIEVPTDYYVDGDKLYVDVPFKRRGKYPIVLNIGGKQAFAFQAEVAKKKKRG